MYSENETVAGAQRVMLEILSAVHRICEENRITYFLDSGTLLGAVRHRGFIPWDDDVDIVMPRVDYEKFLKVAPASLPADLFLQNPETDPGFRMPFTKIRKHSTLLIESGETGEENYHHGIFIDIFPFDYYRHEWFVRWMRWASLVRDRKKKYARGTLKRALTMFYTNVLLLIPVRASLIVRDFLAEHREFFAAERGDFMSYGLEFHRVHPTRTDTILPVRYAEGVFEGKGFYVPADAHRYLTVLYGPDYMQPPPPDRRKTHSSRISLAA